MFNHKYMKDLENSPAAHSVRINVCEEAIRILTDTTTKMAQTQSELSKTTALIQQSLEQHQRDFDRIGADVVLLKADRSFLQGSWRTVMLFGTIFVAACTISSMVVSWINNGKTSNNRTDNGSNRAVAQQP